MFVRTSLVKKRKMLTCLLPRRSIPKANAYLAFTNAYLAYHVLLMAVLLRPNSFWLKSRPEQKRSTSGRLLRSTLVQNWILQKELVQKRFFPTPKWPDSFLMTPLRLKLKKYVALFGANS